MLERADTKKKIAQTKLVIDDGNNDNPEFSFLVIGDGGCGSHLKYHPYYNYNLVSWLFAIA